MKRAWIWGLLALLMAATIALVIAVLGQRDSGPRTLTLSSPWNQPSDLAALRQVLGTFHSLYPNLSVRLVSEQEAGSEADVVTLRAFSEQEAANFVQPPVAWTGSLWVLAARTDLLLEVGKDLPQEVEALRGGRSTPSQFLSILKAVAAQGYTPFTLGNSHKWPFLVLLQHWSAATLGPEAVSPFPSTEERLKRLEAPFQELMAWKSLGWFAPSVWSAGWAQGLQPLDAGKAAFSLVSEGNLGAVAPEHRSQLEFLAFPSGSGFSPWSVGSAVYLAARRSGSNTDEALVLLRYLTSPGVTAELTRLTGRPFFAWSPDKSTPPQVLASWADAALSAPYNALSSRFDPR